MLSHTKTSAFLLSLTYLFFFLAGSAPVYLRLLAEGAAPADLTPLAGLAFGLVFLGLASFLFSRSSLVHRLGAADRYADGYIPRAYGQT